MKVKVVDCKGPSEGKTCYDLCFNKRHIVARIDNESGEGKIVGEKDSHIFADYDQESGDIIVRFGFYVHNAYVTLKVFLRF